MKKLFASMAVLLLASSIFAIEVNQSELQSAGSEDTIKFQNYTGPHAVIESVSAITGIGINLAKEAAGKGLENYSVSGQGSKYTVIHAIDPDTKTGLDADILFINANATVDHIKNLRRIIAGYLTEAYGYSKEDATTIATFVTVYNAVYRGQLSAFTSKYKEIVTKNLTDTDCGLSTIWSEWPGHSQIVIPLSDINGGLSTIDTSIISDRKVVNSMQEEDDKGIDERKNMVDIKERESDAASDKAMDAQKDAAIQNRDAAAKQSAADEAKKEQQQLQKTADETQKAADEKNEEAQAAVEDAEANPKDKDKQLLAEQALQAAEEAQKAADEAKQAADEAETKAEEAQAAADDAMAKAQESSQEAADQQKIADKKQAEAQNERTEIAKDQKIVTQQQLDEQNNPDYVTGLSIVDEKQLLSALVKVNGANGKVVRESEVKEIRNRTVLTVNEVTISLDDGTETVYPSLYMAVCGTESGKSAVRLCLIDMFKMEIQKESEENISPASVLVTDGSAYYVVIKTDSGNRIAKYDKNLSLLAQTEQDVSASTPITITSKGLLATDSSGNSVIFSAEDLKIIQ